MTYHPGLGGSAPPEPEWQGSDSSGLPAPYSKMVRLRDVQSEVEALWREAGGRVRGQGGDGLVRLREANLLVYVPPEGDVAQAGRTISETAGRHPARAIVLMDLGPQKDRHEADPGEGGPLAWLTAACHTTEVGGRSLCWEQITIPARGEVSRHLHAAAAALLVPELPTALWWPGEPTFTGRTFEQLAEVADLVVVDSSAAHDGLGFLSSLSEVLKDPARDYGVDDLNWMRLLPWRTLTAQVFDEPVRRPWLAGISRVTVRYVPDGRNPGEGPESCGTVIRSLLMISWLATRLGWELGAKPWREEAQSVTTRLSREGSRRGRREGAPLQDIEVGLERIDPGVWECDGLAEVSLDLGGEPSGEDSGGISGERVVVKRSETGDVGTARVWENGRSVAVGSVDVSHMEESRLLSESLDFLGADSVAEEAALFAAELASLPGAEALWP